MEYSTLIIAGSEREESLTNKSAVCLSEYFANSKIINLKDYPLAIVGRESEDKLPEIITEMEKAQHIIFLSPEYNWGISPSIKNLLDRLSVIKNDLIWSGKVFMCGGVSIGTGGQAPIIDMWRVVNKLIAFSHSCSIVSPYSLMFQGRGLSEDKQSFTSDFREGLERNINRHKKIIDKFLMN